MRQPNSHNLGISDEEASEDGNKAMYNAGTQPKPQLVYSKIIFVERRPTLIDFVPMIGTLFIYAIILQTIVSLWNKLHKKSCQIVLFTGLFFCPLLFYFYVRHSFLLIVWIIFCVFVGRTFYKITKKPMGKNIARETYEIFRILFWITNCGIFMGQFLVFVSFCLFPSAIPISFFFLIFFLYFGLLSRDTIHLLSEIMANNTGFYSKEGVPGKGYNDKLCMICTTEFDNNELIHTLSCNHSFHAPCIKGWCIIGKKDFCPYCKKGVDYKTLPPDMWFKTEVWFTPMLSFFRGIMVFLVTMLALVSYKLYRTK